MKKLFCLFAAFCILGSFWIPVSAVDVTQSEKETYEHEETGIEFPYRLILPDSYDDRYQFSLVVFFHGAGERGVENENHIKSCVQDIAENMPKSIILAPQCSHFGQWVDTPWDQGCYSVENVAESDEMMAVMDLIAEIVEKYAVNQDTIYAAGYSMGGFAVWDAMVRHNDVFAAGVAVCGAGDPSKAELLKDTPMFVFHGGQDDTVPVSGSTDMVEAIQNAGGTKVQYQEYGESGHGIWGQVFRTEFLYTELKKCKLTDRYPDIFQTDLPPQVTTPVNPVIYYILGGIGIVIVALIVVLIVGSRKKPEK